MTATRDASIEIVKEVPFRVEQTCLRIYRYFALHAICVITSRLSVLFHDDVNPSWIIILETSS